MRRCATAVAILLFGVIGLAEARARKSSAETVELPRVDIVYPPYGTIFDRTCSNFLRQGDVKPEWIEAAGKLRSSFQAEWDAEGPKYLGVVLSEIGIAFPYREMQAVLTVCPVSTMSMPLMINVRSFVSGTERPPAGDFSEKVFHELMHHDVAPVHSTSALRKKYAGESAVTVNHLHVMALEKLALSRLGKPDELRHLDRLYRTDSPSGDYKRAWEIVVDIEGYESFIKELKTVPK